MTFQKMNTLCHLSQRQPGALRNLDERMSEIDPQAFAITVNALPNEPILGFKAIYFSLITLSTVGYGDIVPVSNIARMLAAMEAMIGTLYITVFIARLVALYTSQASANEPSEK